MCNEWSQTNVEIYHMSVPRCSFDMGIAINYTFYKKVSLKEYIQLNHSGSQFIFDHYLTSANYILIGYNLLSCKESTDIRVAVEIYYDKKTAGERPADSFQNVQ